MVANVYAREAGVARGPRIPAGCCGSPWRVAAGSARSRARLRLLAATRRLGAGPARGAALPHLHPDLHEPARHHRLREPPRRPPRAGRARPAALRRAALRVGRALHHARPHRGDAVPLHELLLDRALRVARPARRSGAGASSARRPWACSSASTSATSSTCSSRRRRRASCSPYEFTRNLQGYPRFFSNLSARRLLAPARGQPRRLPFAARRGLAGGAGLRLALRAAAGSGPAAFVLGLWVSTIYLRHHYVVDLLGGLGARAARRVAGAAARRLVGGKAARAGIPPARGAG